MTFGSKMARSFGQMTNSNKSGLDNPLAYAEVMTKLFGRMHIFGEHTISPAHRMHLLTCPPAFQKNICKHCRELRQLAWASAATPTRTWIRTASSPANLVLSSKLESGARATSSALWCSPSCCTISIFLWTRDSRGRLRRSLTEAAPIGLRNYSTCCNILAKHLYLRAARDSNHNFHLLDAEEGRGKGGERGALSEVGESRCLDTADSPPKAPVSRPPTTPTKEPLPDGFGRVSMGAICLDLASGFWRAACAASHSSRFISRTDVVCNAPATLAPIHGKRLAGKAGAEPLVGGGDSKLKRFPSSGQ